MSKQIEDRFFDLLTWRRDIIFRFCSIPKLEKLKKAGDKTGLIYSFFRLSQLRKHFPGQPDDVLFGLLEGIAKEGKVKFFHIVAEPENLMYDLTVGCALGEAIKTFRCQTDGEQMRLTEAFQHLRLYADDPLTEKEMTGDEVILNVKERIESEIEAGRQRIESRQPKSNAGVIELELLKQDRIRKAQLEQELLDLIKSRR